MRERPLVTQHKRVCWACRTSFIKLSPGSVFAPLLYDSQGEHEKEKKIERKRRDVRDGEEGRERETMACEEKQNHGH